MTTPRERLRAIGQTGSPPRDLRIGKHTPQAIRDEAILLLRHCPSDVGLTDLVALNLRFGSRFPPEKYCHLTGVRVDIAEAATQARGSFEAAWLWPRTRCAERDQRRPLQMLLNDDKVERPCVVLGLSSQP
jgi:hypothetical protein